MISNVRKVNRYFIISMLIPSLVMLASFVLFFALLYTNFTPSEGVAIGKYTVAAIISGVVVVLCTALLFVINAKKYELIKDFGIERTRAVVIDSLSSGAGMAAVVISVFYTLITSSAALASADGTATSQALFIPVFVVALVFMPSLLPSFLTQRKIKVALTKR